MFTPSPTLPRKREREPTEFAERPLHHARFDSTGVVNALSYHAAAADLPIAAFTRGMTSSAINCIERLLSAGSTQSMPA